MSDALAGLINDEVARAEADMAAKRNRAQAVLTASGALVTLLTGLLAVAISQESGLHLTRLSEVLAVAALLAFVAATVCVLLLYRPVPADAADVNDLARVAKDEWGQDGYDRDVAMFLVEYLRSLRAANKTLSRWLLAAIAFEVLGVALTSALAMALLFRAGS